MRAQIGQLISRVDAWQVPALRAAFIDPAAKGFYFDSVSQTHMPSWTSGHCVVIGDAGHCASLLSGMGTTLAIVAAELLANAFTEFDGDLASAAGPYHERFRAYVEHCQNFAQDSAPIMVPATQEALDKRNASFRAFQAKFDELNAATASRES